MEKVNKMLSFVYNPSAKDDIDNDDDDDNMTGLATAHLSAALKMTFLT